MFLKVQMFLGGDTEHKDFCNQSFLLSEIHMDVFSNDFRENNKPCQYSAIDSSCLLLFYKNGPSLKKLSNRP